MAKQKSTYYLTEDVRAATKVAAVAGKRTESEVVEQALRQYLKSDAADKELESIRDLMDRVGARFNLSEDEAMKLAVDEVRAHRAEKRRARQA